MSGTSDRTPLFALKLDRSTSLFQKEGSMGEIDGVGCGEPFSWNCESSMTGLQTVWGGGPYEDEDEEKLYENAISSGINFRDFNKISVEVKGENRVATIPIFACAGLRPIIMENIKKSVYTMATPIQKYCLPVIMTGRDVMACAQTGSGKTAAFLIPIIHEIVEGGGDSNAGANNQTPQCVVITPTRELAIQEIRHGVDGEVRGGL